MNLHLISFGDSSCKSARKRLRKQAIGSGYFQTVSVLSERELPDDFRKRHSDLLKPSVRGFGFWIWKPRIILDQLSKIDDGDALLYLDVGCHIQPNQESGIGRYLNLLERQGSSILCSVLPYPERSYTKNDVFEHFGVAADSTIVDSGQRQGGVVFYKKTQMSLSFLTEWLRVCQENVELVDDSPSTTQNHPDFVEHRHDQSIFSVLSKISQVGTFDAIELMQWSLSQEERITGSFPIEARRDRYPKRPLYKRLGSRIKKGYSRRD